MSKLPPDPIKHHFVPSSFISEWSGKDDKVSQMRMLRNGLALGKIHVSRQSPLATGYQRHLNTTLGVHPHDKEWLERDVFSPLDNDAAVSRKQMLLVGLASLSNKQRGGWMLFLAGMKYRNPRTVAAMKEQTSRVLPMIGERLRRTGGKPSQGFRQATHKEWEALNDPAAQHKWATEMMIDRLNHDETRETIGRGLWHLHRVNDSPVNLLISDQPMVVSWEWGDLDTSKQFIALPIAPKTLFIASADEATQQSIISRPHADLVADMNQRIVQRAWEYVWDRDESQLEFVREHFTRIGSGSNLDGERNNIEMLFAWNGVPEGL